MTDLASVLSRGVGGSREACCLALTHLPSHALYPSRSCSPPRAGRDDLFLIQKRINILTRLDIALPLLAFAACHEIYNAMPITVAIIYDRMKSVRGLKLGLKLGENEVADAHIASTGGSESCTGADRVIGIRLRVTSWSGVRLTAGQE